jgi:hypothetical protein
MRLSTWFAVLAVLFSSCVMSAPNLSSTYAQYLAAVDEKQNATSVYEHLQELPSSPVVQVLRGSTLTLMGRDAWMPWTKMKLADEGIALLERTLRDLTPADHQAQFEGVPVDNFVTFITGATYTRLPDLFHKKIEGQALLDSLVHDQALQHFIQKGASH